MNLSKFNEREINIRAFDFNKQLSLGRNEDPERYDPEAIRKKKYEEAYKAGEKAGFEAGLAKAGGVLQRLEILTHALEQSREERYTRLEEEILDLIFRIAEKVIHCEVRKDVAARTAIVVAGLRKFKGHEKIRIRISSPDLEAVQEALPTLCAMNGITGEVILQEDPGISEGGCILETDQCEVDARIEKGLQVIEEALKGL